MTIYEKVVLVTGVAGFIGSHFVNYSVKKYRQFLFIGIDKLNYASDLARLEVNGDENFQFIELDLGHQKLIDLFNDYKFTEVINFAAESSVDKSFDNPVEFTRNNILSSQNLLECIRLNNHVNFIHVSTDEVYGELINASEDSKLVPTNPYSATKASFDLLIQAYAFSYNIKAVIVRSNNIYGKNQFHEKLIPRTIKCLKEGTPIPIHGNGSNTRCFLHIQDFLSALDLVWLQNHDLSIVNIGHQNEIDNLSLVKLICKLYDPNIAPNINFVQDRNYNDRFYSLNCDNITNLGWKPKVKLEDSLKTLVDDEKLQN